MRPDHVSSSSSLTSARADDEELWEQARNLQTVLDGRLGTHGDIDGYYRELQRFAD